MNRYIKNILMPLSALVVVAACSESDVQELFPDAYKKILYIKESGEKNVTLYVTGQDAEYTFKVCKGGSDTNQSASGRIEVMTQKAVDETYSIPYGEPYKVLSSDLYTIGAGELDFGSSDMAKTVGVKLNVAKIRNVLESDANSVYMLPLQLVSATDSVNSEHNRYILIINNVSEPLVGFKKTGVEEFNCVLGKPFSLKIPVSLVDVENRWNINIGIGIDNGFLANYNAENGTAYQLPDIGYNLTKSVALTEDRQEASVEICIPDFGERTGGYMMIPIALTDVSMFSVSPKHANYAALIHILGQKLDRSGWEARACSWQGAEQFDGWSEDVDLFAQNVLDGDPATKWHYKYGSKGEGSCEFHGQGHHCIMIDSKSEHTFTQIGLQQRQDFGWDGNHVAEVRFWISSDPSVWSNNAGKSDGWMAIEGVHKLRTSHIDEQVIDIPASTGRYIKVEVVSGGAGQDVGTFAEIYGYGK